MLKYIQKLEGSASLDNKHIIYRSWLYTALMIVGALPGFVLAQENSFEDMIGYSEFRLHCAVCHGRNGEGAGTLSGILNVTPQQLDLRDISVNNNNVYPYRRIFEVIDGRQNVAAHGERMMPIWGDRYSADAEAEYGAYDAETVVNGRILELVYFLQGIQQH